MGALSASIGNHIANQEHWESAGKPAHRELQQQDTKRGFDSADLADSVYSPPSDAALPEIDLNRATAMDILVEHKDELDRISSKTKQADGNFNIQDIHNLRKQYQAGGNWVADELGKAATFVSNDEGLLREIDGALVEGKKGHSDGGASWEGFTTAQRNAKNKDYLFTGYKSDMAAPADVGIDEPSQQRSIGNCSFLATVAAVSTTGRGREMLSNMIVEHDDGSCTVVFPGDKDKTRFVIDFSDMDDPENFRTAFGGGDKHMQALNIAADLYFKNNGRENGVHGGVSTQAMDLLTGSEGKQLSLGKREGEEGIRKFLVAAAPRVGKDMALTVSGHPGSDGNMSWDHAGHVATVTAIDLENGVLHYTNPWNSGEEKSVPIDVLVKQMANGNGSSRLAAEVFGEVSEDFRNLQTPSGGSTGIGEVLGT